MAARLMSPVINLDTHIVLDLLEGRLKTAERAALEADQEWCIADIVLFEIAMLESRRRIAMSLDQAEFVGFLGDVRVVPVDLRIARAVRALDFRSDPADMLIAATSLAEDVPLMTRDGRIRGSRLLRFAV